MKSARILTGLAIAALSASVAVASPMGKGEGRMDQRLDFEQIDADKDGKITRAEVEAAAAARFAAMDTDGDGAVSAEEMAATAATHAGERAREQHARMLQWRDANGDDKLTAEEMDNSRMLRMFERMDKDGDGVISREEADAMRDRMARHQGKGDSHGRHGKGRGQD